MRCLAYLLIATVAIIPAGLLANEGLLTPAKGSTCKQTRMDPDHAREESEWRCEGPAGYRLTYFDSVMQAGIGIGFRGKELVDDTLQWPPAKDGIGSRVEWRIKDGTPIAAIVGRWRRAENPRGPEEIEVQELLVIKVTPTAACAIGVIGGLSPTAMTIARTVADNQATTFRCGNNKPLVNTDLESDATKTLDARFASVEILDHNGSIVELRRSRVGTIEIRYREPRASLMVEPGTLLFRGAEHNGRVDGEAFVFKSGCKPAAYNVSGRRENGGLLLEGIAPHRGKGCSVVTQSKIS
jgi:hypothetical protein